MSKLSERLLELMTERNVNAPKLATLLEIDRSAVNRFLRAERTPVFSCFVKMLYIFNCSADYLLGLKDIPGNEPLHEVLPFRKRLQEIMRLQNVTQAELLRELPVSSSVLYKWLNGISQPSTDTLVRLSAFFECSVDYLIGRVR